MLEAWAELLEERLKTRDGVMMHGSSFGIPPPSQLHKGCQDGVQWDKP